MKTLLVILLGLILTGCASNKQIEVYKGKAPYVEGTTTSDRLFNLPDLASRSKNCLHAEIENPDDELLFAIILKNFSDRQIKIEKKIIDFIINRIDRSYSKISQFIYKIDELSLKKKKPIDFKIIKEILKKGEQI